MTLVPFALFADNGGPDDFGYKWRDNQSPNGPVYNWIDITSNGTMVLGLGDDNYVGPFSIGFDFHYYFDTITTFYIGSNGYISLNQGNSISPGFNPAWPYIPTADGKDNFLAPLLTDLILSGTGNAAQCYYQTINTDTLIISFIDVPFWSDDNGPPPANQFKGLNTFQVILSAVDSSITYQYMDQQGSWDAAYNTMTNPIVIGIENVDGTIGLEHSNSTLPDSALAIKFYYPDTILILGFKLTATPPSCDWNDGTATVNITSGVPPFSFLWNNGQTTQTATGLTAGTYSVTTMDNLGSSLTKTVAVPSGPPLLVLAISSDSISCFGGNDGSATVLVSGGITPYSYFWSDSQITQTAVGLTAGEYIVTVTDSLSCQRNNSISVHEPDQLNTVITHDSSGNATATVTGGIFPYQYLWSTGHTTQNVSGLTSGEYTVTITDHNGCLDSTLLIITGLLEPGILDKVFIYPNPTSGVIILVMESYLESEVNIEIVNVLGNVIDRTVKTNWAKTSFTITLDGQPDGTYFVKIHARDSMIVRKILLVSGG
ncbi:MAG: T9SS type A sorting domain-containing protein [Bacteroidetes bacterium]|nr:T9SS type A sorting domain-containing protein [Bacteroidota bacterium]